MRSFRLGSIEIFAIRTSDPWQRHLEIRNRGLFFGRFIGHEVSIGNLLWVANVYKNECINSGSINYTEEAQ